MLYIFHVGAGQMLTFDMNYCVASVALLKSEIERVYKIPIYECVLLASGGVLLDDEKKVCTHSAGTDTNPIFLLTTVDLTNQQPWPSIDIGKISDEVTRSLEMPDTYETVIIRYDLVNKIINLAKDESKICGKLVHEQHWQQLGWSAVIANLDDVAAMFINRSEEFLANFDEYEGRREELKDLLSTFENDLIRLAEIPVLAGLVEYAESHKFVGFDKFFNENNLYTELGLDVESDESSSNARSRASLTPPRQQKVGSHERSPNQLKTEVTPRMTDNQNAQSMTLLQWIAGPKVQTALRKIAEVCTTTFQMLSPDKLDTVRANVTSSKQDALYSHVRQIKGLESRLTSLASLMRNADELVEEIINLAGSLIKNKEDASKNKDPTIIPVLCSSHHKILRGILERYQKLTDIRKRIIKAKEELSMNIVKRLPFINLYENKMMEIDAQLVFMHHSIRRCLCHLRIIEEIHIAPSIYVSAVSEVVRRKRFSNDFLRWANNLAAKLMAIYSDEIKQRADFRSAVGEHFMCAMFNGLNDVPSTYGMDPPIPFDTNLPELTTSDVEELSKNFPHVVPQITPSDLNTVIELFKIGSEDRVNVGNKSMDTLTKPHSLFPQLKDGCDSETDTEEFEKVCRSPIEKRIQNPVTEQTKQTVDTCTSTTSIQPTPQSSEMYTSCTALTETCNAETLTEDNLGSTRTEVENLKRIILELHKISQETIDGLRDQLAAILKTSNTNRSDVDDEIKKLSETWTDFTQQTAIHERELIQRMTVDHELELVDIKNELQQKLNEMDSIKNQSESALRERDEIANKLQEVETKLNDSDKNKELALNELRQKLRMEHKTEIESLRCRFKLMSNMERSPSDTSLEKIDRHDVENMMRSTREVDIPTFDRQFETAPQMSSSPRAALHYRDMLSSIISDKDQQLDNYREREIVMKEENNRLKQMIDQITSKDDSEISDLKKMLEESQYKISELEGAVKKEQAKKVQFMEKSTMSISETTMTQSTRNRINSFASIEGVTTNDVVVIVWNAKHNQFTLVQESPVLFFVHPDSYRALKLEAPPSADKASELPYYLGLVTHKEFCHAKKSVNRYNVQKGTRFYRVKVIPYTTKSTEITGSQKNSKSSALIKSRISSDSIMELKEDNECNTSMTTSQTTNTKMIDSEVQTDCVDGDVPHLTMSEAPTSLDMIDSGVVKSDYKERTESCGHDDDDISTRSLSEQSQETPQGIFNALEDDDITILTVSDKYKDSESDVTYSDNPSSDEDETISTDDEEYRHHQIGCIIS